MIGYAIDARRQHFSDETQYSYRPHVDAGLTYRWDEAARQDSYSYQLRDLII
jgi:hypothetical protein